MSDRPLDLADAKTPFTRAAENETPTEGLASRYEKDRLENERERKDLVPELKLELDNTHGADEHADALRERRIAYLQKRLNGAGERLGRDWSKARDRER